MTFSKIVSGFAIAIFSFLTLAIYTPSQALAIGQWTLSGSLQSISGGNTRLVTLQDGKVLAIGGNDSSYSGTNVVQLYDPATGQWSLTGSLPAPRNQFIPVLLDDGKVLVAGGQPNTGGTVADSYLYDPTTGTWSTTGSLNQSRSATAMLKLSDGRVMILGGDTHSLSPGWIYTTEIYDPATGQWTYSGDVNVALSGYSGGVAVLSGPRYSGKLIVLQDGKVLLIGGAQWGNILSECEIYDPTTGQWTQTGSLNIARDVGLAAQLLPDGRVFVAAGGNATQSEIYDPATGTWTLDASLNAAHDAADLVSLTNGKYLIAGGWSTTGMNNQTEVYSLTTTPTTSGIKDTITQMYSNGSITKLGSSLNDKLIQAQAYIADGNYTQAGTTLQALINQIQAQIDIHITAPAATVLIAQIQSLMNSLPQ